MLKTKLKFKPEPEKVDSVAEAIIESAKRTDASNKALIEAVKSIMMAPPQVQVVYPEAKIPAMPIPVPRQAAPPARIPQRRVFGVNLNAQGVLAHVSVDGQNFTVERNKQQQAVKVTSGAWEFLMQRDAQGQLTEIIAEPL